MFLKHQFLAAALASFASLAMGHGIITTPVPRAIGAANLAACGTGVYNTLKSDKAGPIENAAAKVDSGYNPAACHLFFCRGLQYEDNKSNTRVYKPGTVVPFHVDIIAHHTGYANVSVVDLTAQRPIGKPLFNWPVYTNNSLGPQQRLQPTLRSRFQTLDHSVQRGERVLFSGGGMHTTARPTRAALILPPLE